MMKFKCEGASRGKGDLFEADVERAALRAHSAGKNFANNGFARPLNRKIGRFRS